MKVQFLGATGTVTGSKTLIEAGLDASGQTPRRILVDCGLFQGLKDLRLKNRSNLEIDPTQIDAVILTHAHLDHSGYLPILIRSGFTGRVFCTAPTRELTRIILLDAGKIQEEDAGYANEAGFSKHKPALPLFTTADADRAIQRLEIISESEWFEPCKGVKARFRKNGHILGSCSLEIESAGKKITFSGDLGRSTSLLHSPPKDLEETDFLVLESTYGDRNHILSEDESENELAEVIERMKKRKGQLIIPSFAVGRTQEVLLLLSRLRDKGVLPESIPVFLDSPMGEKATDVLKSNPAWHHLHPTEIENLSQIAETVTARDKSLQLSNSKTPKIIIAGSGMATGGRVLHHLVHLLPDPKTTVLFVGFQALGTRGRDLLDGRREIKIHGHSIYVRAHIEKLESLSAHADQSELVDWVKKSASRSPGRLKRIFIQHGEPQASQALKEKIESELGIVAQVPKLDDCIDLNLIGSNV